MSTKSAIATVQAEERAAHQPTPEQIEQARAQAMHEFETERKAPVGKQVKKLMLTSRAKMGAARKPTAKAKAPTAKPKAKSGPSMVDLVDGWLVEGITFELLYRRAKTEAEKRGVSAYSRPGDFKTHIRNRTAQGWKFEQTEKGVRVLHRPTKVEKKPTPKAAKPKAAKAKKNGKANGKKVVKNTNGGRESVQAA